MFSKVIVLVLATIAAGSAYGQSAQSTPKSLPSYDEIPYGHGNGLVELVIDYETGKVTSAKMLFSTGNKEYDVAALQEARTWLFQPHTFKRVKIPITFGKAVIKSHAGG